MDLAGVPHVLTEELIRWDPTGGGNGASVGLCDRPKKKWRSLYGCALIGEMGPLGSPERNLQQRQFGSLIEITQSGSAGDSGTPYS
jgi:hypothetical protein